jgi:hypothetical protein
MTNASTEKLVDALLVPSLAFSVCGPLGTVGIVTTQENPPDAFELQLDAEATESRAKSIG